jgi:hypothetical protein
MLYVIAIPVRVSVGLTLMDKISGGSFDFVGDSLTVRGYKYSYLPRVRLASDPGKKPGSVATWRSNLFKFTFFNSSTNLPRQCSKQGLLRST